MPGARHVASAPPPLSRERALAAALDAVVELVWVIDRGYRILDLNEPARAALRSAGHPQLQIGDSFLDIVGLDGVERFLQAAARTFAGERVRYSVTTPWPDGSHASYDVSYAPITDARGDIVACTVCAHDVTSRRDLETRLEQSRRLESIAVLAGALAHDFQNFMSVVSLDLALLSQLVQATPGAAGVAEEARQAAAGANALARQLLALGKREPGPLQPIDLGDVVRHARPLIRAVARQSIEIEERLADAGPVVVDAFEIERVLVNLVSNARDAMSGRGTLRIETARVLAGEPLLGGVTAPQSMAVLRVTDSGRGMDAATRARIFEPLFTTKARNGTGLGLTASLATARNYGGDLLVESAPGEGATFVLALPYTPVTASLDEDLGGLEVLAVDDEPGVLVAIERVLTRRGARVQVARSPAEALERVRESRGSIRIALIDRVLGEESGIQLAQGIRAASPSTAIVIVSGDERAVEDAERIGVSVLPKPFTASGLVEIVAALRDESLAP